MINALSATTADPAGHVLLTVTNETTPGETRRRVSRVATLDGGSVVNDAGFSDGDRTIDLAWAPIDRVVDDAIDRIVQLYSRLIVSTRAGCFLCSPETYTPGSEESTLRLLVIERISA